MKKILFILFLLNTIVPLVAQDRISEVRYQFVISNNVEIDCVLIHNQKTNKSTFINLGFDKVPDSTVVENREVNGDTQISVSKYNTTGTNPEYQKNFDDDILYSYDMIYGERNNYIISEQLPKFNWVIKSDVKDIMGYKAQKATTDFRGRVYEAWFVADIDIADGPYKFYGLPGLILEVYSLDEKFKFLAYSLKINKKSTDEIEIDDLYMKFPKVKRVTLRESLKIASDNEQKEVRYQLSKNPNISNYKIARDGIEKDYSDLEK